MKGAFLALAASALLGSAAAGSLHDRRHAHQAFHLRRNTPAPVDSATCSCTTYVTTFYREASLVQPTEMAQMTQSPHETQSVQESQSEQETTTLTATVQPTTTVQSTQYTTITVVPTASSSAVESTAPVASSSSVESSSAPAAPVSPVESSSAPAAPASSIESSSASAAPVAPTAFVTVCPTPGTYTIPATTMTLTSEITVAAPAMATLSSSSESQTFGGVTTVVETSTTIVCPYATVSPTGSTFTSVIMTTTYVCPSSGTYVIAPTTTSVTESTVMVYPTPTSYSAGTYTQPETTITVTRTSDVFVCPYTSSAATTTEAASTSSAPAAAVSVSSAASSSSAAASSAPAATAEEHPAVSSSVAPSSSAVAAEEHPAASSSAAPSSTAPVVAVSVSLAASSSAVSSSAAPVAPASQSSSQSSSVAVSSSAAPSKSAPASPIGGGKQWCMTYSPYTSTGQCKDSTTVLADIAVISSKGFSSIRIYSTDCDGLVNVGAAAQQHNLKLVLGIYISKTGISAAQAQVTEIVNWAAGNWAAVEMIVIGNEAVFNHYVSMSELASFISSAKSIFRSAGFTGHVTTTEPMNILQEEGSVLCAIVDVLSANIHPFFNPDTTASDAGQFVAKQLKDLEKVCPGLSTYNLETGWPHSGDANGVAVPGSSQQEEAIKAIQESAGGKSVFFSFIDDMWKEPGAFGVEQSWGCSHLFGH